MTLPSKRAYAFGECSLDVSERRLLRNGVSVPLTPRVFDTLVLLLENAGHLVEKDQFMEKLWPGTFVGEDALTRNISILRKALGESSDSQALIVTVPTRGYRFEAQVGLTSEPDGEARWNTATALGTSVAIPVPVRRAVPQAAQSVKNQNSAAPDGSRNRGLLFGRSWRGWTVFGSFVLGVGAFSGFMTFLLLSPAAAPRVVHSGRITHSGRVDSFGKLVTDGSRIYFLERDGDHWNLMQASVSGGESQRVPVPFKNAVVLGLSPDRANLLIASFESRGPLMPLWIWPSQGGPVKRVGNITAYDAIWNPNGRGIVYSEGDGVYTANLDGSGARKFVSTDEAPGAFSWSPSGRSLRFSVSSKRDVGSREWEVNGEGEELRQVLPSAGDQTQVSGGSWTPDGRYFFLDFWDPLHGDRSKDTWVIPENRSFFRRHSSPPVRLTNGPSTYEQVVSSSDGRKLFVIVTDGGGDLVRYDLKSQQASSVLSGVCVTSLAFSRDGAFLSCKSASDGTLVRMKIDGSERFVLAPASLRPTVSKWSPDGTRVVFEGVTQQRRSVVFLASSQGGTPTQLFQDESNQVEPAWSPDSRFVAFSRVANSADATSFAIQVVDLSTNQSSLVPNSLGLRNPQYSPDGRYLAASTQDLHKLMLFDFRNQHWSQIAEAKVLNGSMAWSRDAEYLYFQDLLGQDQSVLRVKMSDRKIELAATFETLFRSGVQRVAFVGLAPDGSLTLAVDRSRADIYALDLYLP
jgi:DNA-binding winged helix-turn-helix (wHTH) protein/Tol biopolymer transport system component